MRWKSILGSVALLVSCGDNGLNPCPKGETTCGEACVDMRTDRDNCGSCGQVCEDGGSCRDGHCTGGCVEQCGLEGERVCDGEDAYRVCGQYDADACMELSPPVPCQQGYVCEQGACLEDCQDNCPLDGSRRCQGDGVDVCGDFDSDTCLEWGGHVSCPQGTTCQHGECMSGCRDECLDEGSRSCSADGPAYQICGQHDADTCLDLGPPTACPTGFSCENGECTAPCTGACAIVPEYEPGFADSSYILEYHFDGNDGSAGPIRDSSNARHEADLKDGASRTPLGHPDNLYGRALSLTADAYVETPRGRQGLVAPFQEEVTLSAWIRPESSSLAASSIISKKEYSIFGLYQGKPVFAAWNGSGWTVVSPSSDDLALSAHDWAHVHAYVNFNQGTVLFQRWQSGTQSWGQETVQFSASIPTGNAHPLQIGIYEDTYKYAGLIDELQIRRKRAYNEMSRTVCPDGSYACHSEVLLEQPVDWPMRVPVYVRVLVNTDVCNEGNKCRLLVTIQGGGRCSDGYQSFNALKSWADRGYVAAAILPHCMNYQRYAPYPQETSIIIQAIEKLYAKSATVDGDKGYYVTGTSKGSQLTALLYFREHQHGSSIPFHGRPQRAVGRSGAYDFRDQYLNMQPPMPARLKREYSKMLGYFGTRQEPVYTREIETDPAHAGILALLNKIRVYRIDWDKDMAALQALALDSQRDYMATWGYDDPDVDPGASCFEAEGGFTYGGRQLKALWEQHDPDHHSGYFLETYRPEDPQTDCRHGLPAADPFFACVYQFFAQGPDDMPADPRDCVDPSS